MFIFAGKEPKAPLRLASMQDRDAAVLPYSLAVSRLKTARPSSLLVPSSCCMLKTLSSHREFVHHFWSLTGRRDLSTDCLRCRGTCLLESGEKMMVALVVLSPRAGCVVHLKRASPSKMAWLIATNLKDDTIQMEVVKVTEAVVIAKKLAISSTGIVYRCIDIFELTNFNAGSACPLVANSRQQEDTRCLGSFCCGPKVVPW